MKNASPAAASADEWHEPAELPRKVAITERGGTRTIHYRWLSFGAVVQAFFAVLFTGFFVMMLLVPSDEDGTWVLQLVRVTLGVLAFQLLYSTVAGFLNTTTFTVDGTHLRVHHGPLPWAGNVVLPLSQLRRVEIREEMISDDPNASPGYVVMAQLRDGNRRKISQRFLSLEVAECIQRTLSGWLSASAQPGTDGPPR